MTASFFGSNKTQGGGQVPFVGLLSGNDNYYNATKYVALFDGSLTYTGAQFMRAISPNYDAAIFTVFAIRPDDIGVQECNVYAIAGDNVRLIGVYSVEVVAVGKLNALGPNDVEVVASGRTRSIRSRVYDGNGARTYAWTTTHGTIAESTTPGFGALTAPTVTVDTFAIVTCTVTDAGGDTVVINYPVRITP